MLIGGHCCGLDPWMDAKGQRTVLQYQEIVLLGVKVDVKAA